MRTGTMWQEAGGTGRRRSRPAGPDRRGCTLVELVVALVLCTVGLLAMLGATALLVREVAAESSETRAVSAARSRLDSLAALRCAERTSGSAAQDGGLTEHWWSESAGPGIHHLADSVSYPAPGGARTLVLRTSARC